MSPGPVLCGRYAVGEVVGRGAMAGVRVGRDIPSGNWVAIKALRKELADDALFRTSLRREAQTTGRLRHHSIVALHGTGHDAGYDAGRDEVAGASDDTRGVPFIVMEYVAGWSVRDLLRMGELTGRPPFSRDDPVSVLYPHAHEEPPPASTAPPELDCVLGEAIAKAQNDRFQGARAFREAPQSAAKARPRPSRSLEHCAIAAPVALAPGSHAGIAR